MDRSKEIQIMKPAMNLGKNIVTIWIWTLCDNMNNDDLPETMSYNGIQIENSDLQEVFAVFFENKIRTLSGNARIKDGVYNGQAKIELSLYCTMYHNMQS